jgi:S1-C subfamily serine protease
MKYQQILNIHLFVLCLFFGGITYGSSCPGYVIDYAMFDNASFSGKCSENDIREWGETVYSESGDTYYGLYDNLGKRTFGTYKFETSGDLIEAEWLNKSLQKNGMDYDLIGKYTFSKSGDVELGYFLEMALSGFGFKQYENDKAFDTPRKMETGLFKAGKEGISVLNGYGARFFTDDSAWYGFWSDGALTGSIYYDDGTGDISKYNRNNGNVTGPYSMTSSDRDRLLKIQNFIDEGMDDLELFAAKYDNTIDQFYAMVEDLNSDTTEEIIQPANKELISSIQTLLSELGYSPGPIDGVLGDLTIAAIKAFEYELELDELTGKPSESILVALQLAIKSKNSKVTIDKNKIEPELIGTGTGFYVNNRNIITNYHVIEECEYQTESNDKKLYVKVSDMVNDLALLEGPENKNYLSISPEPPVLGEKIYVSGFPLNSGLKSFMITSGNVSSLTGIGKNFSNFSHTAPSQPGNSGGPILNDHGSVVGILVGSIDEDLIKEIAGSSPQNINFGIKNTVLKSMLEDNQIKSDTKDSFFTKSQKNIADISKKASILIKCYGYSE